MIESSYFLVWGFIQSPEHCMAAPGIPGCLLCFLFEDTESLTAQNYLIKVSHIHCKVLETHIYFMLADFIDSSNELCFYQ